VGGESLFSADDELFWFLVGRAKIVDGGRPFLVTRLFLRNQQGLLQFLAYFRRRLGYYCRPI
jgi:hypothetical protein